MKNKQKAKFFCENCGSEVPENAKMCKVCGKFFISVRCPKCGATGSHNDFSKGCPKCGYAVNKYSPSNENNFFNGNKFFDLKSFFSRHNTNRFYTGSDSSLPIWVYVVTSVVFVIVIFAIYSCIISPSY